MDNRTFGALNLGTYIRRMNIHRRMIERNSQNVCGTAIRILRLEKYSGILTFIPPF